MNTRKPMVTALSAALVLGVAALVQSATLVADDPAARRFEWLSGHWCGESGGELMEEMWLPPEGSVALGVGRTVRNGITTSHEFLRIETRDGVTSLTDLGHPVTLPEVDMALRQAFEGLFGETVAEPATPAVIAPA